MATVTAASAEQRVRLSSVSWETYQRLLADNPEAGGTHFIFDEGELEIMVLSAKHERPKRLMEVLIDLLASAFSIDVCRLGSMTFQREDLKKGFEPDSAYYIAHARQMQGREVNPSGDPPPDLMIEVDITSHSLPRFPIYAAFKVPEIWRYDGLNVSIYLLAGDNYVEAQTSSAFPSLTAKLATQFLFEGTQLASTEWERRVRDWAGKQI
jgi:Uma2 family endonuclease